MSPPRHHIKVSVLCSALCCGGFIKAAGWFVSSPRFLEALCMLRDTLGGLEMIHCHSSSVKEVVPTHQGFPTSPAIPVSRDFCREMAGPSGTHRLSPAGTPNSRHEGGQRSVRSVLKSEVMMNLEATRGVFKIYEIQIQSI